jgi:acyl dehydratase
VSSLFSTIFGRSVAGSIYVSQNLSFKRPVHVGVPVKARIEVLSLEDKRKGMLMTCITTCSLEDGTTAVTGEAKVLLPYEK